jgi:hypothetical protein
MPADESESADVDPLGSVLAARLAEDVQRRSGLSADLEARGYDEGLLDHLVWEAISVAYRADPEIYDDGYERSDHLWAAAKRQLIAKGFEAVLDHPAVWELIHDNVRDIYDQAATATWVGFNGGGNGEELGIARAHSRLLSEDSAASVTRPPLVTSPRARQPRARQSRGRAVRRRGSRRPSSRSTGGGGPGDDPDPEPSAQTGAHHAVPPIAAPPSAAGSSESRTTWDIGVTGFGAMLGSAALGTKGMVIGGFVAYIWGRFRWPENG